VFQGKDWKDGEEKEKVRKIEKEVRNLITVV
jgi:hypothetical protein